MYKRKCGRMTVGAWLGMEIEQSSIALTLLLGTICVISAWIVRFSVGSPYTFLHAIHALERIPPVWLLSALASVSLFTVGCSGGFVIGYRSFGRRVEKYRALLWFLLLIACELIWYAIVFSLELLFLGVLWFVFTLCVAVAVTVAFSRVSKFASAILLLHDLWLIYLLVLCFSTLLGA